MNNPHIIEFNKIGTSRTGFITVLENNKNVSFLIKRIFYTYWTPESIIRGRHANRKNEEIIIALTGKITITTEIAKEKKEFVLDKPNIGLYIPKNTWVTMKYSHTAIQLVIASEKYNEKQYIRRYQDFKTLITK